MEGTNTKIVWNPSLEDEDSNSADGKPLSINFATPSVETKRDDSDYDDSDYDDSATQLYDQIRSRIHHGMMKYCFLLSSRTYIALQTK